MKKGLSRRQVLAAGGAALGGEVAAGWAEPEMSVNQEKGNAMFKYCLNTSTISGQKLKLVEEIEVAAKAGYRAIELWVREIDTYVKGGGTAAELKKRIADLGLAVENAIGFARWIVEDETERKKGLEQMKRDMELVGRIGCKRIAAPPAGATDQSLNLLKVAERYRAVTELGEEMGVTPQIEIWGSSKTLSRLGEALLVAAESGSRQACVLPDVFHMYKAGSEFAGLRLLGAAGIQMIHMNDYPANPPRANISDQHRVYPGDGVAPLASILKDLRAANPQCVLSLELFNREYWKQDALTVAKTGLEKMKAAVKGA
jgi:sugar phosphate isomerase/epimerase